MIIEFELQGSKCLHKGVFDTTGFWCKYEAEAESVTAPVGESAINTKWEISGYKIFSHFSFSYYHEDKAIVDLVYSVLIGCLRGAQGREIENIGYFRKLNK